MVYRLRQMIFPLITGDAGARASFADMPYADVELEHEYSTAECSS